MVITAWRHAERTQTQKQTKHKYGGKQTKSIYYPTQEFGGIGTLDHSSSYDIIRVPVFRDAYPILIYSSR